MKQDVPEDAIMLKIPERADEARADAETAAGLPSRAAAYLLPGGVHHSP